MAARSEAIANIQAELDTPLQSNGDTTGVLEPRPAVNVDPPTPLSKDEEKKQKQQEKEAEKAKTAEEKRIAEIEAARNAQQQKVQGLASSTLRQAGNIWQNTKVRIGDIPTPGSIMLPLAILLLGFFILIPVNGHSRFVWLWLALSGNAKIGLTSSPDSPGASAAGETQIGPTNPDNVVELPGGSNLLLPFPNILSFSGNQDVS